MNVFYKYMGLCLTAALMGTGFISCSDDESSAATTVDIALSVSGQLTDSTTGEPVANATLSVSGSLEVKAGLDRAVSLVTTTTTDDNGFYELILQAGAFTHTIQITDEDGNDLGSIDLTITEDNTVDELDTSNAPGITASIPSVSTIEDEPEETVALDLAGTYADTEVTSDGVSIGSTVLNTIIDDNNQVIFGSIRGSYFSSDGTQLSIPLGSGSSLGAICSQDGETVECTATDVEIGGDIIDSIELVFTRTSDSTTIPDGSGNIEDLLTMVGFNDGFLSTEWGIPTEVHDDDDSDKADSQPGAEIDKVYIGDYDGATPFIAVFIQLTENVDKETGYRITLRNDTYSEILIDIYDPDGNDSGEGFTMQHRVNDDDHTDMNGDGSLQGSDWDFNESSMNSESVNAVEFWFKLSALTNGSVDKTLMTDMEIEVNTEAQEDGDSDSDVSYPLATFDFFQ